MGTAPLTSHCPSYSHKKEIKAVLSPRTPDPQLASQLRELSLHICIHAYSWHSNEELQHGRTICWLRYARCLQLAVMLLYEKLQAHGTDAQLKTQPGGYKPNLPAAAAASHPHCATAIAAVPHAVPPSSHSRHGSTQGSCGHGEHSQPAGQTRVAKDHLVTVTASSSSGRHRSST